MAKHKLTSAPKPPPPVPPADRLLGDLREMIEAARAKVAIAANAELTLLYWRIGRRIHSEILSGERAPYGEAIVAKLSQQLVADYGRGFTYTALTRMVSFFEAFPEEDIVATLSQQLSWSHFRELLPLKQTLQREYYRWLDKHEREADERLPLGIILCAGKKSEQIELLELDRSGIHVAEYLTTLPSREVLGKTLHLAAQRAKRQLEQRVSQSGNEQTTPRRRLQVRLRPKGKSVPKKGGRSS